jgi:hypothetical protein
MPGTSRGVRQATPQRPGPFPNRARASCDRCAVWLTRKGAAPAEGWPGLRGLSRWVRRLDILILPARHDGLMKQSTGRPMLAEHHVAAIAVVGMALGIMAPLFWFYW